MVQSAFEGAYLASFSRLLPGIATRIVSLRVAAIGRRPAFDFAVFAPEPSASVEKARLGCGRSGSTADGATPRCGRDFELPVDARIVGPAILEQPDATTVIEPGLVGRIDKLGNLIVEPA